MATIEEAIQRIPPELRGLTFFSQYDEWLYHLDLKPTTCDVCIAFAQAPYYRGSDIRGLFPYLEIEGPDRIAVHVHPNCGCFMTRYVEGEP